MKFSLQVTSLLLAIAPNGGLAQITCCDSCFPGAQCYPEYSKPYECGFNDKVDCVGNAIAVGVKYPQPQPFSGFICCHSCSPNIGCDDRFLERACNNFDVGFWCRVEEEEEECPGGRCGGDPHFQTWSGSLFDYHGQCDLVFLQAPEFDSGLGLNIHIRTKARAQYSFIESAALKIGSDILEVSSYGEYKLNGVAGAQLADTPMAGKYPIAHTPINKKQHLFEIRLEGKDEAIVISTNKDLVGVSVGNATKANFGTSQGLMGEYVSGKMLARDGETIIKDPNAFGQEWQVLDTEPMLFDSVSAPQYPEKCNPPGDARTSRRLGEVVVTEEAAAMACAHWSEDHKELCVYDVMAMNDLEIADAGTF